ncbi:hypothetical protein Tco_1255396 [Tanacetum coccineum]
MTSESTSQSLPKKLTCPTNVHFELADGHIAFNNSVVLLDLTIPEFKDMLQFLSKCCILKALVIQPSAVYNKYLRDLWYSAKVLDNTITFSLSHIEKSLSFDRDIFASIIGLEYSKEYVSFPDHEAMKDAIATLGLSNRKDSDLSSSNLAHSSPLRLRYFSSTWKGLNIDIAGVLYDDLISKLTARGKKGREKNICYMRYLSLVMEHLMGKDYTNNNLTPTKSFQITSATFKKPTSSKVPLTSHKRKVAKLDNELQVTSSKGANIETSSAMYLSRTSKHPASVQKAKPNKKRRHAEGTEVTTNTTKSLDASMSAEEQENQPQTADAAKAHTPENDTLDSEEQDNVVTEEINMGDDGTEFDTADENPFDTKSEIKFVKIYKPVTDNEEPLFTSKESDIKEDSELASIPDDEIGSPSAFQTSDTKESLSEPKLSKSEEKDADNMESNITKKVSEEVQSFMLVLISEALKQELPSLLTDALKTTLPTLLKDLIKESVDTSIEEKMPVFNK